MSIVPNPNADFSPAGGVYTELKPFRFWCQKVLPLVYDDSLSYYELLCKVVDYLNKTMEDVDNAVTEVQALHAAYDLLEAYVNDYFSTLDVQQEINNKLDAMVQSGALSALISPFVTSELPGVVEEQIPGVVGEQIGGTVAQQIGGAVAEQIGGTVAGQISPVVSEWLDENITPTTPAVDASLSVAGAAADAKVTGDTFANLKGAFESGKESVQEVMPFVGYKGFEDVNITPSDTIYKVDGDKVITASFSVTTGIVCDVNYGEILLCDFRSAVTDLDYVIFFDDDLNLVKKLYTGTGAAVDHLCVEIPVPLGATKVCVSSNTLTPVVRKTDYYKISNTQYVIDELRNSYKSINLLPPNIITDDLYVVNGEVRTDATGTWALTNMFPLSEGEYAFSAFDFNDYATGYRIIFNCYDSNGNFISSVSPMYSGNIATNFITLQRATKAKITTIPSGTKFVRLQMWKNVSSLNKLMLTKRYEYTGYYSEYGEPELNIDAMLCWYYQNQEREIDWRLLEYACALNASDKMSANTIDLSVSGDLMTHDATLVTDLSGEVWHGYVVTTANQTEAVDAPGDNNGSFVRLYDVDITREGQYSVINTYTIAERGTTFGEHLLTSAAGVPNAVLDGTVLHILFTAKIDNESGWSIIHCAFDTVNNVISSYDVCNFAYNSDNFAFNTANIVAAITSKYINGGATSFPNLNASIALNGADGYYYGCICNQRYWTNGIIIKTQDFINWIFVKIPEFTLPCNAVHEGAMGYASNRLYLALRQDWQYQNNSNTSVTQGKAVMLLAMFTADTLELVEDAYIPDDASRPCFFSYSNVLYMIHSVYGRKCGDIVKLNPGILKNSTVVFQVPDYCNYPSIDNANNSRLIAMVGTKNNKIHLTAYLMEAYTQAIVNQKFKTALEI